MMIAPKNQIGFSQFGSDETASEKRYLSTRTASVALSFDGGDSAGDSQLLTFYDTAAPPRIVALSPPDGQVDLTTLVTLRGTNFAPAARPGSLLCRFGDAHAPATFVHATSVACHAPPTAAVGAVPVHLSTDAGASWVATFANGDEDGVTFVYYDPSQPPTVSGVSPAASAAGGGAMLTLSGSNFVPPSAAARAAAATRMAVLATSDGGARNVD